MRGAVALPYDLNLLPYGDIAWVKEMADGRLDDLQLTARADGQARTAKLGSADKSFGRARRQPIGDHPAAGSICRGQRPPGPQRRQPDRLLAGGAMDVLIRAS